MADGCARLQILVRMILPLSIPGLLPAGIFCFTLCWNEFDRRADLLGPA